MQAVNGCGGALGMRGWTAIWLALLLGFALVAGAGDASAWPRKFGPFAYVANYNSYDVSVIDITANKVVGNVSGFVHAEAAAVAPDGRFVYVTDSLVGSFTGSVKVVDAISNQLVGRPITVGAFPLGIAVTPNGKFVYVANFSSSNVSVIATAANAVTATIGVDTNPVAIAISPDGTRAFVASRANNVVSVIDTATNRVVARIPNTGGNGIAVTPDLKYVYASSNTEKTISAIDAATNNVAAIIQLPEYAWGLAVTPDGRYLYAGNVNAGTVTAISTASNTIVKADIPVGPTPRQLAIDPSGTRVYVVNGDGANVSLIDIASNTALPETIPIGASAYGIGIIAPPAGVPFKVFTTVGLTIAHGATPNHGSFNYYSDLTLGDASNGIHPDAEPVTLKLADFSTTIPPGSFVKQADGSFSYVKWIGSVLFNCRIAPQGGARFGVHLTETGLNLPAVTNPVQVQLTIGDDSGLDAVYAVLD